MTFGAGIEKEPEPGRKKTSLLDTAAAKTTLQQLLEERGIAPPGEPEREAEPAVDLPPEGASYDEWLGFLGRNSKKETFEGYEVSEEDPFGDLKEIKDDWEDLIEDEDLELDDEGKARLQAVLQALPS
eukprot:COSAG06_NODE_27_length_32053_cov_79.812950_18_plen_128_part_00